jgi:hypothetical protein
MPHSDLRLELRSGSRQSLPGTVDLAALLLSLSHDPVARASLEAATGVSLAPLLPAEHVAEPEPDWLRAEEMLDDAAACPGERLLASSLAMTAAWWRPALLQEAARRLAALLAARGEAHLATQCQDLARVVAQVPGTAHVRLVV